jgi:protein tyrosine phosphatase
MVLKHNVESVVMLTSFMEDDKEKCYEYFPTLNEQKNFENIKITCKNEINHSTYIKRIMEVEKVEN